MHAGLLQHSWRQTRCMLDGGCSQLSRRAAWYGLALNSWRSISFIILHLAPLSNTQNSSVAPARWEPGLYGTRSYSLLFWWRNVSWKSGATCQARWRLLTQVRVDWCCEREEGQGQSLAHSCLQVRFISALITGNVHRGRMWQSSYCHMPKIHK